MLCYTGDTSPAGLDENPMVYEARILITEMSFVRVNHPREKIHGFGHMHIDDFIERAERFQNELVIAAHVSSRYEIEETKEAVAQIHPGALERAKNARVGINSDATTLHSRIDPQGRRRVDRAIYNRRSGDGPIRPPPADGAIQRHA